MNGSSSFRKSLPTRRLYSEVVFSPQTVLLQGFVGNVRRRRLQCCGALQGTDAERADVNEGARSAKMAAENPGGPVLAKTRSQEAEKTMVAAGFQPVLNSFNVFVAPSHVHGWGVFAAKEFVEGELLHESPGRLLRGTAAEVRDDVFEVGWDDEDADNLSILGLGFASLHNHADEPNTAALWERSQRHQGNIVGTFYALRPIATGEELLISYGDDWWRDRRDQVIKSEGDASA